jgi:hypothetical protein
VPVIASRTGASRIIAMAGNLEAVLQGLEEAREFARTYEFMMTDEYRTLIAWVEAMPQNQPSSDKSSVWPAMQRHVGTFTSGQAAPRR